MSAASRRTRPRTSESAYSAKDIRVLEGLAAVRKRPAMYIGGVDRDGLHHLVWETLDNAVDEAMNGHAARISVAVHDDGSVSVRDDGRGIPVDPHQPSGRPALEVILTTLHAGGKFERGVYRAAGGLHGVGASVVNALSASLTATVWRARRRWRMEFARGKPVSGLEDLGPARGSGTEIRFLPDPEVFPDPKPDPARIAARLEETSFLHRGLRIAFRDEPAGRTREWRHRRGLADYFDALLQRRKRKPSHEAPFQLVKDPLTADGEGRLEVVLGWTEATRENFRSYVNGIPTGSGGSHEAGLREGLAKAVRQYLGTSQRTPRGLSITADDAREGVLAVLSVFLPDPQFQGQTKDRLNNPEIRTPVDAAVRVALEKWLHQTPTAAERIAHRVVLAARAREASRAAAAAVTRKAEARTRSVLPGKLSDCASRDARETEIFVVEGDSAGGSAKQGRDRVRQAVLPLRGKILNAASATQERVLKNRELRDIVLALGCGFGKNCDPERLRYRRVILLADADADGHHITTLLLAYFVNYLAPLLRAGRVYVAQPPLFRLDFGGRVRWARDEAERDRILESVGAGRKAPVITRFKGLGEMPPRTLWETTLNPATRTLLQVRMADVASARAFIRNLMGRNPAARRKLIHTGAPDPTHLDV